MKAKVLKHIDIPELYGKYYGEGEIVSLSQPYLYPMTFSLNGLRELVKKHEGFDLMDNGWKEIIVEVNEIN